MELMAEIIRRTISELEKRITRPRFRLPIAEEEIAGLLTISYMRIVNERGKSMVADATTKEAVHKVAKWLTSEDLKPMIILGGGVGNGKTTMAKSTEMVLQTLREQVNARIKEGLCGLPEEEKNYIYGMQRYLPTPEMVTAQDIANLAGRDQDALQQLAGKRFLIIDDLGCEPREVKNYGTSVTPVTDILYKRYDRMLPTMVTTNLTGDDIRQVYGTRIADRFNEVFEIIGYNAKSYR